MTMAMCRPETESRCARPESRIAARSARGMALCPPVSSAAATAPAAPGMRGGDARLDARRAGREAAAPSPSPRRHLGRADGEAARRPGRRRRRRAGSPRRRDRPAAEGARTRARTASRSPGRGARRVVGAQAHADAARLRRARPAPKRTSPSVTRRPSGSRSTSCTMPVSTHARRAAGRGGGRLPPRHARTAAPKPSAAAAASADQPARMRRARRHQPGGHDQQRARRGQRQSRRFLAQREIAERCPRPSPPPARARGARARPAQQHLDALRGGGQGGADPAGGISRDGAGQGGVPQLLRSS